jgi:hypothetical protein
MVLNNGLNGMHAGLLKHHDHHHRLKKYFHHGFSAVFTVIPSGSPNLLTQAPTQQTIVLLG